MNKVLVGEATFDKLGNDMFWEYTFHDDAYNFFRVKWQGYDDAYWWTEVEHNDRIRKVETNGVIKVFELDHKTNEVYLLEDNQESEEIK